jgi:hypothetical protein
MTKNSPQLRGLRHGLRALKKMSIEYSGVQDVNSKSQNVHAGSQDLQRDVMSTPVV